MRERKTTTVGTIADAPSFTAREDGKFTEAMAAAIRSGFATITKKINGFLSLGDGAQGGWTGNVDGYSKDFTFPAVANTEVTVPHELGRVPRFVIVALQDRAGSVYVSNYAGWGNQRIYLKCSVADLTATLLLL